MDQQYLPAAAILGFSSATYLSGIFFASSVLTIPTLYGVPAAVSAPIFRDLYHRGIPVAVSLQVFSTTCSAVAAYLDPAKRTGYLAAGLTTLAGLPWTVIIMLGVNDRLVAIADDERVREKAGQVVVVGLLKSWYWMNLVRSGLAAAGGAIGLLTYIGKA